MQCLRWVEWGVANPRVPAGLSPAEEALWWDEHTGHKNRGTGIILVHASGANVSGNVCAENHED